MKAVVLKKNKSLVVEDKQLDVLNPEKCRIKIHNVGLCSSDIERSFGNGAYFYPLIMGHEISGEILKIGKKVDNFTIGDRVAVFPLLPCFNCTSCDKEIFAQCYKYSYFGSRTDGGYAEYLDTPKWNLLKIPDNVTYEDAALIEPLSVVVHALKRFDMIDSNNKRLIGRTAIIGAGFLGLLASQILRIKFPEIDLSIIDRNKSKLKISSKYTNDQNLLINASDWLAFIKSNKFENVIEATGSPEAFKNSISLTSHGGNILWMGNITGDLSLPKDLVSSILRKELSIYGTWNSLYKPQKPDDWKDSVELIQSGVKPSELVTNRVTLDEVPKILKKLHEHKLRKKIFDSIKTMVNNISE